jgi:3-oxoacyl-[acyl-carrier-protein] synthase-3
MALSRTSGININGIVSLVPTNVNDNLQLTHLSQSDREALIHHTGIRYRRTVNQENINIKNLFVKGITNLLSNIKWEKESIDILICVTQTPHVSLPAISCQLHGDLGFSINTMCYDINLGCSGFVYGLHTLSALLNSLNKLNARAILCCGDISTQLIQEDDHTTQPIFSDAASVIAVSNNAETLSYFNLESNGSGQKAIYKEDNFMKLNGIDVFNYSLTMVPNNILNLLSFADKKIDLPYMFIFHQANKLINEAIRKKLLLTESKIPSTLYEYGNTSSASIPLTLCKHWNNEKPNWVLFSGFGVGFSVASALIYLNNSIHLSIIET